MLLSHENRTNGTEFRAKTDPKHLNTPRLVADDTQKTVWKWEQQEPFGVNAANEDPDGNSVAFEFNLRFPGQYFDKETGFHQNYFRDYDSKIGRYLQTDPVGLFGGINLYSYVSARPTTESDSRGLVSPSHLVPFLPAAVINGLVNSATIAPAPVVAATAIAATQAYQYTIAVNIAATAVAGGIVYTAAGVGGFATGFVFGSGLNYAWQYWISKSGNTFGVSIYEHFYCRP